MRTSPSALCMLLLGLAALLPLAACAHQAAVKPDPEPAASAVPNCQPGTYLLHVNNHRPKRSGTGDGPEADAILGLHQDRSPFMQKGKTATGFVAEFVDDVLESQGMTPTSAHADYEVNVSLNEYWLEPRGGIFSATILFLLEFDLEMTSARTGQHKTWHFDGTAEFAMYDLMWMLGEARKSDVQQMRELLKRDLRNGPFCLDTVPSASPAAPDQKPAQ